MSIFPDNNVVGNSRILRDVIKTEDWQAAKETADFNAANRVVDDLWSDRETEQLKAHFKDLKNTVFISLPSSSGENVIPISLVEKLSNEFESSYLIGDEHFKAIHSRQAKAMSQNERLFDRREYEPYDKEDFKNLVSGKDVIVVDDILTTGGSAAEFVRSLEDSGAEVKSIAALMGDRRLNIDQNTSVKLQEALIEKEIPISAERLSQILTRTEAGNMIRLTNSVRTENAREKLTERIQGLLDRGAAKSLGGDQEPGRHKGAKGKNISDEGVTERASSWSFREYPQGLTRSYEITVKSALSGREYKNVVTVGRTLNKHDERKFLTAKSKDFAASIVLKEGIKISGDLSINIKKVELARSPQKAQELS